MLYNAHMDTKAKYTAKDSVFCDLFSDTRNILEMYKTFHPEDTDVTEDSITNITLECVLTNGQYNDCGFIVKDKIIVMAEAQSYWSENILIRALFYIDKSYQIYFKQKSANLYSSTKVNMPIPEIYVIFTGERDNKPECLSLSKEFFGGIETSLEVCAAVIYESDSGDIVNQYIIFCKVFNEQVKLYGRTADAVKETIRICRDRNVLREYLTKRETEVITMYEFLFNQEEVTRLYLNDEIQKGIQAGVQREVQNIKEKVQREAQQEIQREFQNMKEEARREAQQEAQREVQREIQREVQKGIQNADFESAKRLLKAGKINLSEVSEFYPGISDEDIKKLEGQI